MHISLVNGEEGQTLVLYKGAYDVVKVQMLNDETGAPLDITTDTVFNLELYADTKRSAAAVDSIAVTPTTVLAGYGVITVANAEITVTQGAYYGFVKRVTAGGLVGWSRIPTKVVIK